jgi:hypothetical protein
MDPMIRPVRMLMVLVVALSLPSGVGVAAPAAPAPEAGTLVTFVRSGGFAGFEDHLQIRRDGAARAERGGREPRDFRVPADEVTRLEAELEAADFPHLQSSYRNDPPIADGYTYEVTYENRTVRCEQDAGPPALERVIDHLEQILADAPA